jgi:hypothetical protein
MGIMRRQSTARVRSAGGNITTLLPALLALAWAALGCDSNSKPASQSGTSLKNDAGAVKTDAGAVKTNPSAVKTVAIDRSALTDVGTDKPLDYSDPRLWLCRPGNDPDECDANLDATELLPDGSTQLVKHVKAVDPEYDCFYVYPTVKLTSAGAMTDFADIQITLDPLLNQGARFNQQCRMYAPLYRQAGVVPGAGGAPTLPDAGTGMPPSMSETFALGVGDVRDAFKYYLEHLNNGRKFVLLGHSQGTGMLTTMMTTDVDPVADVRAKLISALLIGGGVAVPEGKAVGGTFKNIPLCTAAKQVGCVIAYNSFTKEIPPAASSTFAHAANGQMNGCTEPAMLAGHPGKRYQGSYIALNLSNGSLLPPQGIDKLPKDITTPFVLYRDVLRGECKNVDGASYLEISLEMSSSDPRPPPPYRFPAVESALGLHLLDYNIELDDLLETVKLQAEAALK